MAVPITPVRLGDVVKLKKPHPCGANEWEIVRVGADIGLKCRGCERRVMLVRSEFDRRFRGFIDRADEHSDDPRPATNGDAAADAAHGAHAERP
jgi:hypothetical protein